MNKEIKKDSEKLLELTASNKLLFCLTAFEGYASMLKYYAFVCNKENREIEEVEIVKRSEVLKNLIMGISDYPNVKDEFMEYCQKILGNQYTKKFLERYYQIKADTPGCCPGQKENSPEK